MERMTCSLSSIQAGSWPELPCDWAGRDCCLQDASLTGFCFCTAGASRGDEAGCLGGKNEKKLQREDSLTKRESLWTPVLGGRQKSQPEDWCLVPGRVFGEVGFSRDSMVPSMLVGELLGFWGLGRWVFCSGPY